MCRTITASVLGLAVTVASGLPTASADDSDGAISLRRVSTSAQETQVSANMPVAPVAVPAGSARETSDVNESARSLFLSLRHGSAATPKATTGPGPVPAVPTAAQLRAVQPKPVRPGARSMQLNDVLLASGTDEVSGVVTIPQLLPDGKPMAAVPPIPEPLAAPTSNVATDHAVYNPPQRVKTNGRGITRFFNFDGTVSIFNRRKGTLKTRERCRFIEFYDPELERLDVDDYKHADPAGRRPGRQATGP